MKDTHDFKKISAPPISMTHSIRDQKILPLGIPIRWQWTIQLLVLFHFSAIVLTYSANWRRSALQDNLLGALQPYLICGNWYQEMLPVDWISDANGQSTLRLSIHTSKAPQEWKPVLDSSKKAIGQAQTRSLLIVLNEFAINDDTQGVVNILKSIMQHLEHDRSTSSHTILGIRLEKVRDALSDSEAEETLYEASVARFPNGEFGFVPKLESHRSVRAVDAARGAP